MGDEQKSDGVMARLNRFLEGTSGLVSVGKGLVVAVALVVTSGCAGVGNLTRTDLNPGGHGSHNGQMVGNTTFCLGNPDTGAVYKYYGVAPSAGYSDTVRNVDSKNSTSGNNARLVGSAGAGAGAGALIGLIFGNAAGGAKVGAIAGAYMSGDNSDSQSITEHTTEHSSSGMENVSCDAADVKEYQNNVTNRQRKKQGLPPKVQTSSPAPRLIITIPPAAPETNVEPTGSHYHPRSSKSEQQSSEVKQPPKGKPTGNGLCGAISNPIAKLNCLSQHQ